MPNFDQLRIGETVTVNAEDLDQIGRPGFLGNSAWGIDDDATPITGDPTTRHIISAISVANPTHITTSTAHGLKTGDRVLISGANTTPSFGADPFHIATVLSPTIFTVAVNITAVGAPLGTVNRCNAEIVPSEFGPPPAKYQAKLTGKASGAGLLHFTGLDVWDNLHLGSKPITVINASTFVFANPHIDANGTLILDFQDGVGPGNQSILATPVDVRGPGLGAPAYVVSGWNWADPSGHLALTGANTATVTEQANSQGDGTLVLQALNSEGQTVSGSLPYRVLSGGPTVTLTIVQ